MQAYKITVAKLNWGVITRCGWWWARGTAAWPRRWLTTAAARIRLSAIGDAVTAVAAFTIPAAAPHISRRPALIKLSLARGHARPVAVVAGRRMCAAAQIIPVRRCCGSSHLRLLLTEAAMVDAPPAIDHL